LKLHRFSRIQIPESGGPKFIQGCYGMHLKFV
jgi:hypothetical protein